MICSEVALPSLSVKAHHPYSKADSIDDVFIKTEGNLLAY